MMRSGLYVSAAQGVVACTVPLSALPSLCALALALAVRPSLLTHRPTFEGPQGRLHLTDEDAAHAAVEHLLDASDAALPGQLAVDWPHTTTVMARAIGGGK